MQLAIQTCSPICCMVPMLVPMRTRFSCRWLFLRTRGNIARKKKRIKKQNVQSEYVKEKRRKKKEKKKSVPAVNIVKK